MSYQDVVIDAIERVLALDLPDDVFGQAVNDHAGLLAGLDVEQSISFGFE